MQGEQKQQHMITHDSDEEPKRRFKANVEQFTLGNSRLAESRLVAQSKDGRYYDQKTGKPVGNINDLQI